MSKRSRPTVQDLAREAAVSPSTVDRVLNGRSPVRAQTAQQVLEAAEAIGFHGTTVLRQRMRVGVPQRRFGFLLQQKSLPFHRILGEALVRATEASAEVAGAAQVVFSEDLDPSAVASRLDALSGSCDAVGLATADHPLVAQAIERLQARGKPVFAIVSDLGVKTLSGYVGVDNRRMGRTAGWFLVQSGRKGKVAIAVGTHRHLCQETCEMSFRSYIREHAPDLELLEPLITLESEEYAYEGTMNLLTRHPDLQALYIAGGGVGGVLRALRQNDRSRDILTIALELNDDTRAGLLEGQLTVILSHPIEALAIAVVQQMASATLGQPTTARADVIMDFEVHTPENA